MFDLNLITTSGYSWIRRQQKLVVKATLQAQSSESNSLYGSFITLGEQLLPFYNIKAETVNDLRGRPDPSGKSKENLIYVEGKIEDRPYSFSLSTSFKEFVQRKQIRHNLSLNFGGLLSELKFEFPSEYIFRIIPAETLAFKFGKELYHPRFVTAVFGTIPQVYERCYVEATPSNIFIFVEVLSSKKSQYISPSMLECDNALRTSGIFPNFIESIKASLKN
ncbi:hypothetical protein JNK13_04405 [bacterium]|nr:hypothetical protein [bacterium]